MEPFGALADPRFRQDVARGLLDVGNRGAVAGLLGTPVDMAHIALRPFGYRVEKPVGGSEWIGQMMQDYGIVSPERNLPAELVANLVAPAAAGAVAPALLAAERRAIAALAGIR